jgi:transcriptional regulator with XRE-family HTH domain
MAEQPDKKQAIAERLRAAREHAGLSQGQVAKLLQLHRPSISELEAGRRSVSAEELRDLARIYDVSITWLLCDAEHEEARDPRVELAAREIQKLRPEDLDRLLTLLSTLRRPGS